MPHICEGMLLYHDLAAVGFRHVVIVLSNQRVILADAKEERGHIGIIMWEVPGYSAILIVQEGMLGSTVKNKRNVQVGRFFVNFIRYIIGIINSGLNIAVKIIKETQKLNRKRNM